MRKAASKSSAASEHAEQAAVVQWWTLAGRRWPSATLFAIPNGGARNAVTAAMLKAEGVLAGVPDMFVAMPKGRHAGLFVEMKKAKGGRVAPAQSAVMENLRAAGYACIVARGAAEAIPAISAYLDEGGVAEA